MKFINKLESKLGRFAIENLSMYLIIFYTFGYAIRYIYTGFLGYLTIEPYYILHGQVWRLFTWVFIPPTDFSIFTIITLYFYYSIGTSLERTWGCFRYNLFIFSGMIFTAIGAFVLFGYFWFLNPSFSLQEIFTNEMVRSAFSQFNTYYVNMSIFLGFALTFPEQQVLLMFIIPIKIKWLGLLDVAFLLYSFLMGGFGLKVVIAASLLNVAIYFFTTKNYAHMRPKQIKRRQTFRKSVRRNITTHKCAICGRTELDGEDLVFRFCSKCDGNYEYCQDHLFTHQHIKKK